MAEYQSFNTGLAKVLGIKEAIIFQDLVERCHRSGFQMANAHWIKMTQKEYYEKVFSYMNVKKIRRALVNLEYQKLILSTEFNDSPLDRTKCYAITPKGEDLYTKYVKEGVR